MRIITVIVGFLLLLAVVVAALFLVAPRGASESPKPTPQASPIAEYFTIETSPIAVFSSTAPVPDTSAINSPFPTQTTCESSIPAEPIVVQVFDDFLCPYCAREFAEVLLPLSQQSPFTDSQAEFQFVTLPIHGDDSTALAKAALCAAQQIDDWQFRQRLYAAPDKNPTTAQNFLIELGGDVRQYQDCLIASITEEQLQANITLAQSAGVNATPTLIIDGKSFVGAVPPENILYEIRKTLAQTSPKSLECEG